MWGLIVVHRLQVGMNAVVVVEHTSNTSYQPCQTVNTWRQRAARTPQKGLSSHSPARQRIGPSNARAYGHCEHLLLLQARQVYLSGGGKSGRSQVVCVTWGAIVRVSGRIARLCANRTNLGMNKRALPCSVGSTTTVEAARTAVKHGTRTRPSK